MRLYTIQSPELFDTLLTEGFVCCNRVSDMAKDWSEAYQWMADQLTERVGPAPSDTTLPLWAWYQYKSKKRPMPILDPHCLGTGVTRGVLMEIDVPDAEVLLSDFSLWHYVLNKWALCSKKDPLQKEIDRIEKDAGEYKYYDDWPSDVKQEARYRWLRIFDLNHRDPCYQSRAKRNRAIQAVFWSLKKEYLVHAYSLELKGKSIIKKEIYYSR